MAYDPLHKTTRSARSRLIGFSSALTLVNTFNVELRDIPFQGVELTLGPAILPVTLGLGVLWFGVSFFLYQLDDRKYAAMPQAIQDTYDEARKSKDLADKHDSEGFDRVLNNLISDFMVIVDGIPSNDFAIIAASQSFSGKTPEYREHINREIKRWLNRHVTLSSEREVFTDGSTPATFKATFNRMLGAEAASKASEALDVSLNDMYKFVDHSVDNWQQFMLSPDRLDFLMKPKGKRWLFDAYSPYALALVAIGTTIWRHTLPEAVVLIST